MLARAVCIVKGLRTSRQGLKTYLINWGCGGLSVGCCVGAVTKHTGAFNKVLDAKIYQYDCIAATGWRYSSSVAEREHKVVGRFARVCSMMMCCRWGLKAVL